MVVIDAVQVEGYCCLEESDAIIMQDFNSIVEYNHIEDHLEVRCLIILMGIT